MGFNITQFLKLIFPEYKKFGISRGFYARVTQIFSFVLCFRAFSSLKLPKSSIIYLERENRSFSKIKKNPLCNTSYELEIVFKKLKKTNIKIIKLSDPLSLSIYRLDLKKIETIFLIFLNLPINLFLLIRFSHFYINFYKNLISQTDAKFILEIMPNIYLAKECRKRSITLFDIQHGYITLDHDWYTLRSKNFGEDFYSKNSPTNFFVWDKESKSILESMGYSDKNLHITNIPIPKLDGCIFEDKLFLKYFKSHKKILISLQYSHWYGQNRNQILPQFVIDALAELDSLYLIFKLHPMVNRLEKEQQLKAIKSLKSLLKKSSKITVDQKYPLIELIKYSDIHFTINSSTSIIANNYGVKTIVLDPALPKEVKQLYEKYPNIYLEDKANKDKIIHYISTTKSSSNKLFKEKSMSENIVSFFQKKLVDRNYEVNIQP